MKIGIVGTRGIPNQYGGFEQFAEHFSTRMVEKGHDVSVYVSHRHPYTGNSYKKVKLIRCYDPEHIVGMCGQFIYDLNCIRDSRKQNFDIILQLGYTSSTIWSWLYPKSSILVTNMDGLEWSRAKYNKPTQYFLTHAERWGAKYSDHLIADSIGIQDYLLKKYEKPSCLIPYGSFLYIANDRDKENLYEYRVAPCGYDLLIARFEPENNIETILKAYAGMEGAKLLLVGNYQHTSFGRKMYKEYGAMEHIVFLGPLFDVKKLDVLRFYSRFYLHGHTVGGTNPSLLEAMGCSAIVCAHDNMFNRHVLGDDAFYFKSEADIRAIVAHPPSRKTMQEWRQNNIEKVAINYNWDNITQKIESYFTEWVHGETYYKSLLTV